MGRKAKHRKDYNHGKGGSVGGNPRYGKGGGLGGSNRRRPQDFRVTDKRTAWLD